jgi:hypothetical protein
LSTDSVPRSCTNGGQHGYLLLLHLPEGRAAISVNQATKSAIAGLPA